MITTKASKKWETPAQEKVYKDTGLIPIKAKSRSKAGSQMITEKDVKRLSNVLFAQWDYWLAYPDKLVEFLSPSETNFKLYPFQILAIRTNLRMDQTMQTCTRGYSKSFIAVMTKILKCILVPRTKEFFVAETNKQAAKIGAEKINEIFDLMPLLKEEIDFSRGSKTTFKDDYIRLTFKNGSILDLVSQGDAQRGGRRHGGIFEEVLMLDGEQLSSVVIPLMNISRRTALGEFNEKEPRRQSNYITSAGYMTNYMVL